MPFSIEQLQKITKVENLTFFELGESIQKFTGVFGDQKVLLRIFPKNDYYANRFDREGAALRTLTKIQKELEEKQGSPKISFPKILKEWTNIKTGHSIRALTWIDGKQVSEKHLKEKETFLNNYYFLAKNAGKYMPDEFSFENDVLAYLGKPTMIKQPQNSEWEIYEQIIQDIEHELEELLLTNDNLIHGDFHYGNILLESDKANKESTFAIIDWEFATKGAIEYDLAYAYVFSNAKFPKETIERFTPWIKVATAIIAHWYIINEPNSANSKKWLKKLQ